MWEDCRSSGFVFFSLGDSTSVSTSDSVLFVAATCCFLFDRARLFWNQLYTFVSEIWPCWDNSEVISLIFCLVGVPLPCSNMRSRIWSCIGVGVQRCLPVILWPADVTSGSQYRFPSLAPEVAGTDFAHIRWIQIQKVILAITTNTSSWTYGC